MLSKILGHSSVTVLRKHTWMWIKMILKRVTRDILH
jgi:hypothetical protein